MTATADPRLLARLDSGAGQWRIDGGSYAVGLSRVADDPGAMALVTLAARHFGR